MIKVNYEGVSENIIEVFINDEYIKFPYAPHEDILDALSRITDKEVNIQSPFRRRRTSSTATMSYDPFK